MKSDTKIKLGYENLPNALMINLNYDFRKKLFLYLKSKFKNRQKLCEYLKCSASSLNYYRREYHFIPVEVFQRAVKFCKFNDIEINFLITQIKKRLCGKPIDIILPIRISPDLAALIGHTLGDGHISLQGRFVYVNKEKILINKVKLLVNKVFQNDVYFDERLNKDGCRSLHYPTAIGEILDFFGGIKGNKTLQDFDVPKWIKDGHKEFKSAFLKAIFDDEGSVGDRIALNMSKIENKKYCLINFLDSIKKLLKDLNIESSKTTIANRLISKKNIKTINLAFYVRGYYNMKSFYHNVNFYHKIKSKKLKQLLNSYVRPPQKTRNDILDILRDKTLSTGKIISLLNKTKQGIYYNLHILENEGKIKRIIINKRKHLWGEKVTNSKD